MRCALLLLLGVAFAAPAAAQFGRDGNTSGGPLDPAQAAYDVSFYDLHVRIDPNARTLAGTLDVRARVVHPTDVLVLDLDSALTARAVTVGEETAPFAQAGGHVHIVLGRTYQPGEDVAASVLYGGTPREAANPPWSGGFTWAQTADGRPWIAASNQGEGADLWWPSKDHPSDEPDSMRIALTVPSGLMAIANGRSRGHHDAGGGWVTHEWFVSTPINNYGVSFGIGPYEVVERAYRSPFGYTMPVQFWVLPERRVDAERMLPEFLDHIRFLEETYGPYGFRDDGYKVLHTPYLGMEHQSLIAYGSTFSQTEFGFDWLHFHELAHEWFANLLTASDWRDFWVHEGFASFSEALYAEDVARRQGGDGYAAYLANLMAHKPRIVNAIPVAPLASRTTDEMYNLPTGGFNGDIYFKGAWFLHTLRWTLGDEAFFEALGRLAYEDPRQQALQEGCACRFVSTVDVQRTFEAAAGRDLGPLFEVYLRQPALPRLLVEPAGGGVRMRWVAPGGVLSGGAALEIPVEVEVGGRVQRVEMPDGEAVVPRPRGASLRIDPRGLLLADLDVALD